MLAEPVQATPRGSTVLVRSLSRHNPSLLTSLRRRVNAGTAKAQGVTLSEKFLSGADAVIGAVQ